MKKLNRYRFQIQDRKSKEWFIKNINEKNYQTARNMIDEMFIKEYFLVLPLTM